MSSVQGPLPLLPRSCHHWIGTLAPGKGDCHPASEEAEGDHPPSTRADSPPPHTRNYVWGILGMPPPPI